MEKKDILLTKIEKYQPNDKLFEGYPQQNVQKGRAFSD